MSSIKWRPFCLGLNLLTGNISNLQVRHLVTWSYLPSVMAVVNGNFSNSGPYYVWWSIFRSSRIPSAYWCIDCNLFALLNSLFYVLLSLKVNGTTIIMQLHSGTGKMINLYLTLVHTYLRISHWAVGNIFLELTSAKEGLRHHIYVDLKW